jgi:hypothetical protein
MYMAHFSRDVKCGFEPDMYTHTLTQPSGVSSDLYLSQFATAGSPAATRNVNYYVCIMNGHLL